jgi:hypothetical protein
MTDHNNNKDPLEQFFEKKAGEYNIPFREEDWLRLAGRLDLRDARIAYRRRVMWIAAASLLLVSLLGYFTFENYSRINQLARLIDETPVETVTPIPAEEDPADHGLPQPSSGDQQTGRFVQQDPGRLAQQDTGSLAQNDPGRIVQQDPGSRLAQNDPGKLAQQDTGSIAQHIPGEAGEVPETLDTVADEAIAADASLLHGQTVVHGMWVPAEDTAAWFGDAAVRAGDVPVMKDPGKEIVRIDPAIIWPTEADIHSREVSVTGHQGSLLSRVSASLQMSPDLSTVGSVSNFSSPGYKLGITVQYQISRNLAVSTGVVRSEVRYSARGQDYDPPVYWPANRGPEQMRAVCLLLDIPLTLRYDVLQFSGSRLFATVGLSSYIMLNEEYDFSYDGYTTGQLDSWSGRTGTRHWFSNAGFSVGYELDVHPNWSFLAEPFIAVPLREVGWGNVRLYSVGSYLSVRYRFHR